PDQTKPADGAVEGWRFAVTSESGSPRVPRADGDFAAICAGTDAAAGKKRVAVVIDAGLAEDAPSGEKPPAARGECAVVAQAASGAEVLAAVASARVEKGLVCSLDGYPATGCGDQVEATPPTAPDAQVRLALPEQQTATRAAEGDAPADEDGGPPWVGIAVGAAVVAALGGAAYRRARGGSSRAS
ncbi:MAG: SCO2322 family protein, partial [Actinomycetes bacterium]